MHLQILTIASTVRYEIGKVGFSDLGTVRATTAFCVMCAEIDACESSPCQNGGTCITKFNSYECECGYRCGCAEKLAGTNCQLGGNSPCSHKQSLPAQSVHYYVVVLIECNVQKLRKTPDE